MNASASPHLTAVGEPEGLPRCPIMPTYGPPTVEFVRGEGSYLWDLAGKQYVDWLAGIAVTSLGHANPKVAAAICEQASKLLHVSNLFATEHQVPIAETLDRLIGDGTPAGGQVFFSNSGAEANEAALKLARRYGGHGRHVVVSAFQSFHGRTLATLAATGQPAKWEVFQPLPEGFRHVPWADLAELEKALDETVAAVFLEPIQGEGGVNPATVEYYQGVRALCDERDILFMVDEVQAGLGRTGRWFGFQHFDIEPDVVTMAKALGNGMPIGACWAKASVAAAFKPGDHATTFGGQPMATSAARATLDELVALDAPALAAAKAEELTTALLAIDGVDSVRGLGLLLAAELNGVDARLVAATCLENGLVLNAVTPTALRLTPAITIEADQITEGAAILAAAIATVRSDATSSS